MPSGNKDTTPSFEVSRLDAWLGALVHNHTAFWQRMGNLESAMLRADIDAIAIDRPVFIAGLARSGSTILLELMAQLEGVGTHRYRDFPPIFTPVWWNRIVDHSIRSGSTPTERAHGDRIKITPESPEAFEEALWMSFFPDLHDPARNNVLNDTLEQPQFEQFYKDHLRKILLVRKGNRYVSKGNYNVSRLLYLHKLFPDARFVIPVRHPASHVASLMKQHELFLKAACANPDARDHLRRVGHFEFGPDRVPVNMGDDACIQGILSLWSENAQARGCARYWNHVYGAVLDQLDANPALAATSLIVRYEDFCSTPLETARSLLSHTGLPDSPVVGAFCEQVSAPDYYSWRYSDEELQAVREETRSTRERLGYDQ